MQYGLKPMAAMLAVSGLLALSACDRRGDEYTSPQGNGSEMGGSAGDSMTAPPPDNAPPTPPAEGGNP